MVTLPPEVAALVVDKLESISSHAILDHLNIVTALQHSHNDELSRSLCERIRSKYLILDLCQSQALIGKTLAGEPNREDNTESVNDNVLKNLSEPGKKQLLIIVSHQSDLTLISGLGHFKKCELVFVPAPGMESIQSILKDWSEIDNAPNIENVIIDTSNVTLDETSSGKRLFGILDSDMFKFCFLHEKSPFVGIPDFILPGVSKLDVDYLAIDSFIYNIMMESGGSQHYTYDGNSDKVHLETLLKRFLANCHIDLPQLTSLRFVNSHTGKETCNFIDLSTLMLKKLLDTEVNLSTLFQLNSLVNWRMPNLKFFTGHRFKFEETTMSGSPERLVVSIRENLQMLHDMARNETKDASSYFRVKLIPEGVEHSQIINWVTQLDSNDYTNPWIVIRNNSLKSLELKLLRVEKASSTIVQGLYFPNLERLELSNRQQAFPKTFVNDKATLDSKNAFNRRKLTRGASSSSYNAGGDFAILKKSLAPKLTRQHSDTNNYAVISRPIDDDDDDDLTFSVSDMTCMVFTSWNELQNCRYLFLKKQESKGYATDSEEAVELNYVFSIANLKNNLPKLDLKACFPTFVDKKQRFIVH